VHQKTEEIERNRLVSARELRSLQTSHDTLLDEKEDLQVKNKALMGTLEKSESDVDLLRHKLDSTLLALAKQSQAAAESEATAARHEADWAHDRNRLLDVHSASRKEITLHEEATMQAEKRTRELESRIEAEKETWSEKNKAWRSKCTDLESKLASFRLEGRELIQEQTEILSILNRDHAEAIELVNRLHVDETKETERLHVEVLKGLEKEHADVQSCLETQCEAFEKRCSTMMLENNELVELNDQLREQLDISEQQVKEIGGYRSEGLELLQIEEKRHDAKVNSLQEESRERFESFERIYLIETESLEKKCKDMEVNQITLSHEKNTLLELNGRLSLDLSDTEEHVLQLISKIEMISLTVAQSAQERGTWELERSSMLDKIENLNQEASVLKREMNFSLEMSATELQNVRVELDVALSALDQASPRPNPNPNPNPNTLCS